MAGVVNAPDGTAHGAKLDNVVVAGKTGTAQVIKEAQGVRVKETEGPEKYRDHGWFIAFAPEDHPKIAIACIIEHSGHGGSSAGPVVKAVMEKYFEMNPPQGQPRPPVTQQASTLGTGAARNQLDAQTE
jgi:penicillin-binding protein 2